MIITHDHVETFLEAWRQKEVAENTIKTYRGDLAALILFLDGREVTKDIMIDYKAQLQDGKKPETANHRLRTANLLFRFLKLDGCNVKPVRVKQNLTPENLMTASDLERMLRYAAKRNRPRLYVMMETLVATGIRFSELKFITVEAL